MIVDKNNFEESYDQIKCIISDCKYVSLNLRLTGMNESDKYLFWEDTMEQRYEQLISQVKQFNIIQIGLTFFKEIKNKQLQAYPYNFYTFPKQNPIFTPIVQMESNSVTLHNSSGLDWNKWISNGITYISKQTLDKIIDYQTQKQQTQDLDVADHQDVYDKFDPITQESIDMERVNIQQWIDSDSQTYTFNIKKAFQRRYYYKLIEQKYPNTTIVKDENNLTIKKVEQEIDQKQQQKDDFNNQQKGILRIFELLFQEQKPIITHNSLIDLLFIYHTFIGYFPTEYKDFKQEIYRYFPSIYDTTYILKKYYNNLDLINIQEIIDLIVCKPQIFQDVDVGLAGGYDKYNFLDNSNKQYFYDSGYYSYLVGYIYAKMTYQRPQDDKNLGFIPKSHYCVNFQQKQDIINNKNLVYMVLKKQIKRDQKLQPDQVKYPSKTNFQDLIKETKIIFDSQFYNNKHAEEQKDDKLEKDILIRGNYSKQIMTVELKQYAFQKKDQFIQDLKKIDLQEFYQLSSIHDFFITKSKDQYSLDQKQKNYKNNQNSKFKK